MASPLIPKTELAPIPNRTTIKDRWKNKLPVSLKYPFSAASEFLSRVIRNLFFFNQSAALSKVAFAV